MKFYSAYRVLLLGFLTIMIFSCDTGVETSKDPGIIRIHLQSSPDDTSIVIANREFTVQENDQFDVKFFQAKAYRDSVYYVIYPDLQAYTQEDQIVNILSREENFYTEYIIFESYLPVGKYDRLQFGVSAEELQLGDFQIPVFIAPGEKLLMDFFHDFEINENQATDIKVQIWPFQSVIRFQDSFQFIRKLEITDGGQI